MILDSNKDHLKYTIFDANGVELKYVIMADTESGTIIRCVLTNNGKLQKDHNNDIIVETTSVPAPLKYLSITNE